MLWVFVFVFRCEADDIIKIFGRKLPTDCASATGEDKAICDGNDKIRELTPKVNQAFRIMLLDTVGARGAFIANAHVESSDFGWMVWPLCLLFSSRFDVPLNRLPLCFLLSFGFRLKRRRLLTTLVMTPTKRAPPWTRPG
jgi:hypothetical protein